MTKEALKLALEKIARVNAMDYEYQAWAREALAQTQEPVQFKCTVIDDVHPNGIPLEQWTPPPQRTWVGLTDKDVFSCYSGQPQDDADMHTFANAIEAKLKEKNT